MGKVPQGLLGSVIAWLKLACENGIDARYEDGTPSANAKQIRTLINDLRAAAALRASPEKVKRIKLDDYSCLELTDYPYENRTELRWWLKRDDSYIRPLNEFEEQFVNAAITTGREA